MHSGHSLVISVDRTCSYAKQVTFLMLKIMCYLGKTGSSDAKSQRIKRTWSGFSNNIRSSSFMPKCYKLWSKTWQSGHIMSRNPHIQAEVTSRGPSCQPIPSM